MANRPIQLMRFRTDSPLAPIVIERPNGEVLATADTMAEARFMARVIQGSLRTLPDRRLSDSASLPPAA
ncbi:MAG: hypothetical protein ACYC1C_04315 [Chloroflexota bacterium]